MRARIAVFVGPKGRGSNMTALARAGLRGLMPATVARVIAPNQDCPAVQAARELGIDVVVVEPGEDYGPRLLEVLGDIDLICLAGFLRLLPDEVLAQVPAINIHPSLLPRFGGKGMYGKRVHEAVVAAGEKESGCTVHRVTPVYDEGQIILQLTCPVLPDDTAETLAARVLELEHIAYPQAVGKFLDGR